MMKGSKELIRSINCTNVLEYIIHFEPISRASLSKQLGLTKATISSIVQDLINQKLIIEIGSDETKSGRKPILLSFHKKAGYAISVDLGQELISAVLTDLKGENAQFKRIQTPAEKENLLTSIILLVESMETLFNHSAFGIIGITIGIHGSFPENNKDFLHTGPYKGIDFKKELEHYFQIPVYVVSDTYLSTIGEYTFRNTYASLANININENISIGMITQSNLYQNELVLIGNIGHTIIEASGSNNSCEGHRYLEQFLSLNSLIKKYCEKCNCTTATFDDLRIGYQNQQPAAMETINQFIKYSVYCINNIIQLYHPDILIINCIITREFPELFNQINEPLRDTLRSKTKIYLSKMKDSILYGGIYVSVKHFLQVNHFVPRN